MIEAVKRYTQWLHTGWPGGTVETLPDVNDDGTTNVSGVYVVGDLTGIPLLKFSADSGARAIHHIIADPTFEASRRSGGPDIVDVAIIGTGVSGAAAAMEAQGSGLSFVVYDASQAFSTIKNFPKGKPIYTYPTDMTPSGELQFRHEVKEPLVEDLDDQLIAAGIEPVVSRIHKVERSGPLLQVHHEVSAGETKARVTTARRVIIAIGRSGNFRTLGVPGEDKDKVFNRLHDPKEYGGKHVLVVGGGDSAIEAAIALTLGGAHTTLSYRKPEFARPKPENIEKLQALQADPGAQVGVDHPTSSRVTTGLTAQMLPDGHPNGTLTVHMGSQVQRIEDGAVQMSLQGGSQESIENDVVFPMIGREPPLDFFRRSGIRIRGEWSLGSWLGLIAFFSFCVFIYHWKSYYWFPSDSFNPANWVKATLDGADTKSLLYTLLKSASGPSFYYTLLYSCAIGYFGYRRIQRRKTPYVRLQTYSLMFFQWLPLFILPEIILPLMGRNGFFIEGATLRPLADLFFEPYDGGVGVERAYWRAYGFVLAWPLMVYNWFTDQPIVGWLVLGGLQTFVLIPFIVRRWGKGAFCGWMCSCGALAETLGDTHRQKMPHGPKWNRLNMVGQVVLGAAFVMLFIRIYGWLQPESWAAKYFNLLLSGGPGLWGALSYKWIVDIALAGFLGVGFYFHYSGRIWCRFACPLAALMHIYARFTKFRIFSEKKKCISCNVCTSVCHQGIDIMNFANKGLPMEDPECVRCSACVQSCPTGVLQFGRYGANDEIIYDRLPASLVQMTEALNQDKAA